MALHRGPTGAAPGLTGAPFLTNIESFAVHTTPLIVLEAPDDLDSGAGFHLASLWQSYEAWSAYGAEVPLTLEVPGGYQEVVHSYVPYLSGMQLFRAGPSGAGVRSVGSSCDSVSSGDLCVESDGDDGCDGLPSLARAAEVGGAPEAATGTKTAPPPPPARRDPGPPLFEYFERAPPHTRAPLAATVTILARRSCPDLLTARSGQLHPTSWFAVAWYPLYCVPSPAAAGPARTLQAAFLTLHALGPGSGIGGAAAQQAAQLAPTMCAPLPPSPSPPEEGMLAWRRAAAVRAAGGRSAAVAGLRPWAVVPYKAGGRAWEGLGAGGATIAATWLAERGTVLPDLEFFRRCLNRAG